jgi:O-antigen/teichoic acid export membrane protein
LEAALLAMVAAAYGGCIASGLLTWRAWRGTVRRDRDAARELFGIAGWLVLATLIGSFWNSLDILMLTQLAGPEATGIYSSARTLALPLVLAGTAAGNVLLPRLSRLAASGPIGPQVRHITLRVAGSAILLAISGVVTAPIIVPLVYGSRYAEAIAVFQLLALAYCLQIATWPALSALMVYNRPDLIAKLSFAGLCLSTLGYLLVVPSFGAAGAAWVIMIGSALIMGAAWLSLRNVCRFM